MIDRTHLITSTIVKLIANMSELIYILGKYLGVYAKDSLDELLLITHKSSSYGGDVRKVERSAVREYIDQLSKYDDEKEWAEDFPYEVIEDDTKWNERSETEGLETEGLEYDASSPNGDNFPYIRGHSNPY